MARKIIHQLVDDLDGEVLEESAGETVTFSLDGVTYEIDLADENAAILRQQFEPWIEAGRRISGASSAAAPRARGGRKRAVSSGRDLAAIRTWANANGHKVSDRGRVPESVLQAYDAAH